MPIGKSHAESSTFVLNRRVVIAGGQIDNYLATANIVEYDPASKPGTCCHRFLQAAGGHDRAALGDRLFVTGGYIGANSVSTVSSYASNRIWEAPTAPRASPHTLILPLAFAMLMAMGGLLAVLTTRRHRRIRQDNNRASKAA